MLVLVCGHPGTGKSTVAEGIADRLDARLLRTDVVRKELYPDPEYTDAESASVYDELFDRARTSAEDGRHIVLDGTFRHKPLRERAAAVATEAGVEFSLVRVVCDEETVRERIRARDDDESDADFAIHQQLKEEFEPLDDDHLVVDNSGSLAETREAVDELFPLAATA
jgi:predicted kinase